MLVKKSKNNLTDNQAEKTEDSGIVIYQTNDGKVELDVKLEKETLWLTLNQMALLFQRDKSVISRHIKNIYKTEELNKKSTVAFFATVQNEGGRLIQRQMEYYNLDMIISVGYRVNSKQGTQFRIWATKVLKDYLVQGYVINQKKLLEQTEKFELLQNTINFLKNKSIYPELHDKTEELLSFLEDYSKSLTILNQYDSGEISLVKGYKPTYKITYKKCEQLIQEVKISLMQKNEATDLFGKEINNKLKSIIGAIYQTFNKKDLYPSIEEKAANLLYLIIKDHPFVDGNKRIGSLLFLHFLAKNNYLLKNSGERKINDNTIIALALLIAISLPVEKDIMIKIITNLLIG
ncbi:MAG: virulence protein RhuM/Fic/DOC family protein [Actinobacteria bacterium]|nr:virulence protein RhuM/Fic/DOC family protein [Cyanobacteriota bacterium]MCL5770791.1 virulence protein RhuM/Fic/DOC family protein [Actinomycetota bacterium]